MIYITLSDYAGEQLAAIQNERAEDFQRRLDRYESEVKRITIEKEKRREKRWKYFKEGRFVVWLLYCLWLGIAAMFGRGWMPSKPKWDYVKTDNEAKLEAGSEGENRIDRLFAATPDSFTMIGGYKNYKGEIDRVVVCPIGVLAIEVKNYSGGKYGGGIYVDGDSWVVNKPYYVSGGRLKDQFKPIVEKGGRSPSRQVNESADVLQKFLRERCPRIKRVARAVLLTHENGGIAGIKNPTVDVIAHCKTVKWTNGIENVMPNRNDPLSDQDIEAVVKTIKKDHEYHERRREERINRKNGQ